MTVPKLASDDDTTTVVQRYSPYAQPTPHRYHYHNHNRKWPMVKRHRLDLVKPNKFGYYECPYKCNKEHVRCVHRFLTTASLAAHYFTAHEQNPNRIYCCACRIRFQSLAQLDKHHMAVHILANESGGNNADVRGDVNGVVEPMQSTLN